MRARSRTLSLLLFGLLVAGAQNVTAQVVTPTFMAPRGGNDVGVYLTDLDPGGLGVEGILRRSFGTYTLGIRGGVADAGDGAVSLGAELRTPLPAPTAPLDFAFTAAVQALVGDYEAVGVQGGVSLGHTFRGAQLNFTPYLHPRIAVVDTDRGEAGLEVLADVGFDVDFAPNLSLRFAATFGDFDSFGVGLAWR